LFTDGTAKEIAWVLKTENTWIEQKRKHADVYFEKISKIQSKYIALHVGIFWGIGTFNIKNHDLLKIPIDDKKMFEHMSSNKQISDEIIENRKSFIKQLVQKKEITVSFNLITTEENVARKTLD
jgi:hypothetical protein